MCPFLIDLLDMQSSASGDSANLSTIHEDRDRKVVPRWRAFASTITGGELRPVATRKVPVPLPEDVLSARIHDWQANRTLAFAADLVGSAIAVGDKAKATEAAEFILAQSSNVPAAARHLAEHLLGKPQVEVGLPTPLEPHVPLEIETRRHIHRIRHRLVSEPRNAFLWIDLARYYDCFGQTESANKAIRIALQLAPDNRFVTRAACRHFIKVDDYQLAHDIVRRSVLVKGDPWVLAAEIATASAARRTSRYIGYARDILNAGSCDPFHLSELASALGTLDLEAGKTKRGHKLIEFSLRNPTENAIAQAAWICRHFGGFSLANTLSKFQHAYEASAWEHFSHKRWKEAVTDAIRWLNDQPFSSRPAILGSYIGAITLNDDQLSGSIAKYGLVANPHDPVLQNNLACALARTGKPDKAAELLGRIRLSDLPSHNQVSCLATSGLVSYRLGDPRRGRELYSQSIALAKAIGDSKRLALASLFLALEESRLDTQEAAQYRKDAIEIAHRQTEPDIEPLLQRVLQAEQHDQHTAS